LTDLLYIAPLPPRYSGQTISSAHLLDRLDASGLRVARSDTGLRNPVGLRPKLARLARLIRTGIDCLRTRAPNIYISVNANHGMWITVIYAGLARLRGRRILLHHHTNDHLTQSRSSARALFHCAGPKAINIVICEVMTKKLRAHYPSAAASPTLNLSNVGIVADAAGGRDLPVAALGAAPFVLGHLSNLSEEKGCLRAIETFHAARAAGLARELVLAGPIHSEALRTAVERKISESGGAIRYVGPVYGADKDAFYAGIDVFLFPSLYRNETQGIVNLEALSAGRPVVAFGLCCILEDLADPSCCIVPQEEDFADFAINFLERVAEDPDAYRKKALARFSVLAAANQQQHIALQELLIACRGPDRRRIAEEVSPSGTASIARNET
jgi:glycosyltransferase involved in cell wall biosynthesis